MALPAGRYGVTKNQLLKIKKLPMNTIKLIEELTEKFNLLGTAAFKNSTSVVTQSTDLVESGAVYDALGFGTKNLFNPTTNSISGDVTVVKNADNTYTVNGTAQTDRVCNIGTFTFKANTTYMMSGCPTGLPGEVYLRASNDAFTIQKIDYGSGVVISFDTDTTLNINIRVGVGNTLNNVVFSPMIELGDTKTAYEPYHPSVEQTLRDAVFVEGKNLYADEQDIQFGSAYNLRTETIPLTKLLGAGTYTLNLQTTGTADIKMQIRYNGSYQAVPSFPYTFTVNSGSKCDSIYIYISQDDYDGGKSATASKIQIEVGTEATAYEPYYIPLKDVVPNKCNNSVIGTVEDGTNPTKAYAVDEFMVRDGAFCQVTAPVTTSSTWTEGSNYTKKSIAEVLQSLMS